MSSKKLPLLPENPDLTEAGEPRGKGRFPTWLHRTLPSGESLWEVRALLEKEHLHTVCEEAQCPNLLECWSQRTATFLALGKSCTRNCGFCDIDFSATPLPADPEEPARIANAASSLQLRHLVLTMVARDDLPDGGAAQLVLIVRAARARNPGITVELLTSDFAGNWKALSLLLEERPEIFSHNMETVRALTPHVRHKATYDRSLSLLAEARRCGTARYIKSGLMVGLGEKKEEVFETLEDLKRVGCDIVTIGHYLPPHRHKLRLKAFISPAQFAAYAQYGHGIGLRHVYAGPFVRSSYNAAALLQKVAAHP